MKKLHPWLTLCSSSTFTATADEPNKLNPSPPFLFSDTSGNSSSSSISDTTSNSSLYSNLSLQSLPSIPSLHKLPNSETLNLSVSHLFNLPSSFPISSLSVHANFLYAASNHQINVYDRTDSFSLVDSFNLQDSNSGSVKGISFINGKTLTSHQDGKIRVWKIKITDKDNNNNKQHKLISTLPTVNDKLRRFILPKNYVNVRRHKKLLWIQHADAVTGLAVHDGLIYSVSWDKTLKIWRESDHRCIESVKAHEDAINAVVVSNGGIVYTGSADRRIRVWSKPPGEKRHVLVATLEKHKSAVNALALNDDGSLLFSGACDRSILVWEREDSANHMAVIGALRGHRKAILSLINVSDLLMSGSADCTVRIWQRGQDGRYNCLSVLEGHQKPVRSLVVDKNDCGEGVLMMCSGSLDGEVKVWKLSFSNLNFSPSSPNLLKWR